MIFYAVGVLAMVTLPTLNVLGSKCGRYRLNISVCFRFEEDLPRVYQLTILVIPFPVLSLSLSNIMT